MYCIMYMYDIMYMYGIMYVLYNVYVMYIMYVLYNENVYILCVYLHNGKTFNFMYIIYVYDLRILLG